MTCNTFFSPPPPAHSASRLFSDGRRYHANYDTRRVNHSFRCMHKGVCTKQAESYFSRLRRMEVGTHHHIAGPYLNAYAGEASWREDNRRVANGTQAAMVGSLALTSRQSRKFAGH